MHLALGFKGTPNHDRWVAHTSKKKKKGKVSIYVLSLSGKLAE